MSPSLASGFNTCFLCNSCQIRASLIMHVFGNKNVSYVTG